MCDWVGEAREPSLDEIFGDPIVEALMRRDGVERSWLERLLAGLRRADVDLSQAVAA
jgi:hypothetical protein